MSAPQPPSAPLPAGLPGAMPDVLDAEALERLRELDPTGKNQLIERVFKAFESSVTRLMPQLEQAMARGELEVVRRVAHTIKSSSASIGAIKLSRQCADIEAMVRQERAEGLAERADDMAVEVRIVLQALARLNDSQ